MDDYKKYTEKARLGIKGEAYFESHIVEHDIPHRIDRKNDLGVDFLCEWIYGDKPRGVLFVAQVKSTRAIAPEPTGARGKNCLDTYVLPDAKKPDEATLNYWRGLGLPAYLFYVVDSSDQIDCFYKRYTPLLDGRVSPNGDDESPTKQFFKANDGKSFRVFADPVNKLFGFARDLVVDHARMCYSKGYVVPLTVEMLGVWPFRGSAKDDANTKRYFWELADWHRDKIRETCKSAMILLNAAAARRQRDA